MPGHSLWPLGGHSANPCPSSPCIPKLLQHTPSPSDRASFFSSWAALEERKTLSFSFTFSAPILLPVPGLPHPSYCPPTTPGPRPILFHAKVMSSSPGICPQTCVGLWISHLPSPYPDFLICKVDYSASGQQLEPVFVSIPWVNCSEQCEAQINSKATVFKCRNVFILQASGQMPILPEAWPDLFDQM